LLKVIFHLQKMAKGVSVTHLIDFSKIMTLKISFQDYQKLNQLKSLDIQICSFCSRVNILNLGWPVFGQFYCRLHEAEYVLCPELCYKVCLNIWGCELYREVPPTRPPVKPTKPNKPYDKCACYLCGKELRGAGKTGQIKNRNNPGFWGINTEYRILCLECVGGKYLGELSGSKRKTYGKYVGRGYV